MSIPMGQILIEYYLEEGSADPTLSFTFPDLKEMSLPLQLGVLEMAKDSLMRIAMTDDE